MTRLSVFLDPNWRSMRELFSAADEAQLRDEVDVLWGRDEKAGDDVLAAHLAETDVLISTVPVVGRTTLDAAPRLRAVVEVSGSFPDTIDFAACQERGVEVLSCAPGFRQSVAEMSLAMILAGGRGLVSEHEAFRTGDEHWLSDNDATDFTLFGQTVGFVGYGSIAREIHRLMAPFAPRVIAYDPWLPKSAADAAGIELLPLDMVMEQARVTVVAATPTSENKGIVGARQIARMPKGGLLVVISRAHLVDFDAMRTAVDAGQIRAAVDVFPEEPTPKDDPIRHMAGVILSPHRAAAVPGGRHPIGKMILHDLRALGQGRSERQLLLADQNYAEKQAGVGDAKSTASLAASRA